MTTKTNTECLPEKCIEFCNSLLRGELSAIEIYDQVIEKFESEPEVGKLREIRASHDQSATILRQNVIDMGGTPETDSGAWGSFTQAIQGAANFLGEGAALSSLIQGEELGESAYRDALESDDVLADCKTLIREELLTKVVSNQASLKALRDSS